MILGANASPKISRGIPSEWSNTERFLEVFPENVVMGLMIYNRHEIDGGKSVSILEQVVSDANPSGKGNWLEKPRVKIQKKASSSPCKAILFLASNDPQKGNSQSIT